MVGGISVLLSFYDDFPGTPSLWGLVFVDRAYLRWTTCHSVRQPFREVPR